jgi:hypothetical protein
MPETLWDILVSFWDVLGAMSPYLLLGFLVAGGLSVVISSRLIERHLGGAGLGSVLKAAAFGVPLPLCSCGVIPVSASLRRHGASRGATASFLLSTPQTGVDSLMVTYALLGPVFAIYRPIVALISGVLGGGLVSAAAGGDGGGGRQAEAPCQEPCCAPGGRGRLRRMLHYGFVALPRDIGRALLVGLAIAALISALVPEDFFARHVGGGIVGVLAMMALGVPIYVCATASVPIAYALVASGGASPGAAFAFLVAGPATNAATLAVVWRVLGRRTALVYLGTVAVTAVAGGLLLNGLVSAADVRAGHVGHAVLPQPVKWAAAVLLLGVLAAAVLRKGPAGAAGHADHRAAAAQTARLRIAGMTCGHCAATVQRALAECDGVRTAEVDLHAGRATVTGERLRDADLAEAVRQVGYRAEAADPAADVAVPPENT